MNSKKTGILFLIVIAVHLLFELALDVGYTRGSFDQISEHLLLSLQIIISDLLVLIPAILFIAADKDKPKKWSILSFHKIKAKTVLLTLLVAGSVYPLVIFSNLVSMLFTTNTAVELSGSFLGMNVWLFFVLFGIIPPIGEEIAFRGVIHGGLSADSSALKAIVMSALMFGLMHLNANQMMYAFVMGLVFAFLKVATNSLWPGMIIHFIINLMGALSMRPSGDVLSDSELMAQSQAELSKSLPIIIGIMFIVAVGFAVLSAHLIYRISVSEGREAIIKSVFKKDENKKGKVLSIPMVIALLLSFGFVIYGLVSR
jgi:membrane protease YdiL (CAAX protease family)